MRRLRVETIVACLPGLLGVLCVSLVAMPAGEGQERGPGRDGFGPVRLAGLNVTSGPVAELQPGVLRITHPSVRAEMTAGRPQAAAIEFRYRGAARDTRRLASGALVRQMGLKLRAKNTCNVLYVMWRVEPREEILITLKRNPGLSTHAQCGARGYQRIASVRHDAAAGPPARPAFASAKDQREHRLEAEVRRESAEAYRLRVSVDGAEVWTGTIEAALLDDIDGPAGFRSDNGDFSFRFYARG